MKKISKTFFLTSSSLLVIGTSISLGITLSSENDNNKLTLLEKKANHSLNEKEILEKNPSSEIVSTPKQTLPKFDGTILTKDIVTNTLKWNAKTTITLADWAAQAPNITELGDNISSSDPDGNKAPFSHNTTLQSIEIPSTVSKINFAAFRKATALTTITLTSASNLTSIGGYSFKESGITSINIPSGVTTISESAFASAAKLTSITFEENSRLESIQGNAFEATSLASFTLPDSVTTIANTAFSATSPTLKAIQFPYKTELFLATNASVPLYGLTQGQWNAIEWTGVPTKDVKINFIIAKDLLKENSIISWKELSVFKGMTADSFKGTSLSAITIEFAPGFIMDDNALFGAVELTTINISERYKGVVNKLGLTVEQFNNINYLPISGNSETVNVIALSLMGVTVLIAGVGFFFMFRSIRSEDKLANEEQLAAVDQSDEVMDDQMMENNQNEWDAFY